MVTDRGDFEVLVSQLHDLIQSARQKVLRSADVIQVRTCWEVGHHIVEFEQQGAARAVYGVRLIPRLAERLTSKFGKGFDASNLRYMRLFYQVFPNCDALRHELSWTHLAHQDIGQMDMYVRMYDDLRRGSDDNPTVGVILCARKDASVVRFSVLHGSEQLFASKYKLVLPSEAELRAELNREQRLLEEGKERMRYET